MKRTLKRLTTTDATRRGAARSDAGRQPSHGNPVVALRATGAASSAPPAKLGVQGRPRGVRAIVTIALLSLIAVAPWSEAGPMPVMARQDAPAAAIEIGAGPIREQAFALVGRTVFAADSAQIFGYLTDVIGLAPALLFAGPDASAQTARFTYAGDIPLTARGSRGDVTTFAGEGIITIYYAGDGGASWGDPGSFAAGEPIAELSLELRDTLQRQDQSVGVVVGAERYRQESAGEFVIGGETYRFGQSGIEGRLRTAGALIANDDGTTVLVGLTGAGSVSAREAIPVAPGESGA